MTKKDYIKIAECIKAELLALTDDEQRILYSLQSRFSDIFTDENWRFDRVQFERACGFDSTAYLKYQK